MKKDVCVFLSPNRAYARKGCVCIIVETQIYKYIKIYIYIYI